jgi:hypothetical protein
MVIPTKKNQGTILKKPPKLSDSSKKSDIEKGIEECNIFETSKY